MTDKLINQVDTEPLSAFDGSMVIETLDSDNVSRYGDLNTLKGFINSLIDASEITAGELADAILSSNIPRLDTKNIFTKANATTVVSLTSGSTVSIDASLSNTFRLVAGTSFTLANPTNLADGQTILIRILQDGGGSRAITYGSMYKFPSGADKLLSTAANASDMLTCEYDSTDGTLNCTLLKGFG